MPKFTPVPARLGLCHTYFLNNPVAHSIKDLEKSLPAHAGISGMQVKDYLTALADDNKIRVEKIGSGNWYWCFRGDETKNKKAELEKWRKEEKAVRGKVEEMKEEMEREKVEKGGNGGGDESARLNLVNSINTLKQQKVDLQGQIAAYADNDPVVIEQQRTLIRLYKDTANVYTENILAIESKLKNMGAQDAVGALRQSVGIPEDLDTLE